MIDAYKIHRIVEAIRQYSFEFETDEVIESLDEVLAYYNVIDIDLSNDEYYFLIDELLPLAEEFELGEVFRLVAQDDPLLSDVHEHDVDFRLQAIELKLRRTASHVDMHEFLHNVASV